MKSIVQMLQEIKEGNTSVDHNCLSQRDIDRIINWYSKYSTIDRRNIDVDMVIRLMSILYSKENIYYHPVEVYCNEVRALAEAFSFDEACFLSLHSDYLEIILGDK